MSLIMLESYYQKINQTQQFSFKHQIKVNDEQLTMIQIQALLILIYRNIQLQEQYLIKISSKKNNMQNKINQLNRQDSSQKIINSQSQRSKYDPLESVISKMYDTLDPQHAIVYLDSLQHNNHEVFCRKAELYIKMEQYSSAFETIHKGLQYPPLCMKCLRFYLKLYKVLLPRKLPLLNEIIQECSKNQNIEPQILASLKNIKQAEKLDQPYQDFFKDLITNGAEFSKLSIITENQDNRSVFAKEDIEKDQTILFIPKQKLILLQNARQSEVVKVIHQQKLYLRSPKHCQLTVFLLQHHQMGTKSPYYHYLKNLPKNFSTFPVNFKQQELDYLKGSPFLQQVQHKIVDIKRDYQAICSVCPQFQKYEYQKFKQFRLLVSSRIFGIVANKVRTDALAPLADMLNHHIPKQTSWFYSDQHNGFIIKSLKKIQRGQQIYDSYGLKCNSRFLLNYGFTIAQNDMNEVSIKIPFQYEEQQKVQIYRQITLRVSKSIQSKQFSELLSILRYSVMQQVFSNTDESIDNMKLTPFTNLDIEAQIWQKFQKIIQCQLSKYPTTLKEDRKLLTSKDLSINHYNCIVLRKGEKQILNYFLVMAKKMIRHIRDGASTKNAQLLKQYQSYLKQLNFP